MQIEDLDATKIDDDYTVKVLGFVKDFLQQGYIYIYIL
ncbi:hypothetical protein NC651_032901 [Populus alba x Populus x berolinensis]|nr:hypothetical protein NC651_032901 [Populus alba x Populus x berolinensis]